MSHRHFWSLVILLGLLVPAGSSLIAIAQPGDAEPEAAPVRDTSVARAVICTDVVEREPVGEGRSFVVSAGRLFCFTELHGLEGTTVTHAWIHDGVTRARVELPVRSNRWRTWSTKTLLEGWTGEWQVKVLDSEGIVLHSLDFVVE